MDDFDAFVARTRELGMEVALDLALQASPDHPWVKEHPEWFTARADGSIAYAENPPKKYQDIYPLNFDNDPEGIYAEVLRIVRQWMDHGVRIFRVDNPHTKAAPVLGAAARRDPRHRPRRAVPGRGVHPAGHDAHPGQDRVPPVLHVLHLAQRTPSNSRSTCSSCPATRPRTCGPTSSPTPPTS
jgi:glycosidase